MFEKLHKTLLSSCYFCSIYSNLNRKLLRNLLVKIKGFNINSFQVDCLLLNSLENHPLLKFLLIVTSELNRFNFNVIGFGSLI